MTEPADQLCIDTIRTLSMDAIEQAGSGHPGLPLGMAPAAYVLYAKVMNHDPQDPLWPDRDRFLLSAGHGSMLLYSALHLSGYDLPLDELKKFRLWGSLTPGHPERDRVHVTPGVEVTTGPLGQGFANGVGIAMAEAYLYDQKRVLPAAAHLSGQYGIDDLYVGVPVVIGAGGVEQVIEIALSDEAKGNLTVSVEAVKELLVACRAIDESLA